MRIDEWCRRAELNRHGLRVHHPLKMACLPISPRRHNYGKLGKSSGGIGSEGTVDVSTDWVTLSISFVLPEK